jgi:hypothetical protein
MTIGDLLTRHGVTVPADNWIKLEGVPVPDTYQVTPCLDALVRVGRHLYRLDYLDGDRHVLQQLTVEGT